MAHGDVLTVGAMGHRVEQVPSCIQGPDGIKYQHGTHPGRAAADLLGREGPAGSAEPNQSRNQPEDGEWYRHWARGDNRRWGLAVDHWIFIQQQREVHFKLDRKSTRLNSSHLGISYAVFC